MLDELIHAGGGAPFVSVVFFKSPLCRTFGFLVFWEGWMFLLQSKMMFLIVPDSVPFVPAMAKKILAHLGH